MNSDFGTYPIEPFEMITKDGCSFCDKAKALFKEKGIRYAECNIDDPDLGTLWRGKLKASGLKTVPQIYEYNKDTQRYDHIGGYTELEKYLND